jgi:hypothetical protein
MSDRIDTIRARLINTFTNETPCSLSIVRPEHWNRDGGTGLFGWQWPIVADSEIVLPICFEVFAEATEHFPDGALDMYLDIIEFLILRHIVYLGRDNITDVEARIKRADDDLWDIRPDAMTFLSDLQMAVLDENGGDA